MPDDREKLIRENFDLERGLLYPNYRRDFWNDVDVVRQFPNPQEREAHIRGRWDHESEKHYAGYRESSKDMSINQLRDLQDDLILQGSGMTQWQRHLAEIARGTPANDNDKEMER